MTTIESEVSLEKITLQTSLFLGGNRTQVFCRARVIPLEACSEITFLPIVYNNVRSLQEHIQTNFDPFFLQSSITFLEDLLDTGQSLGLNRVIR